MLEVGNGGLTHDEEMTHFAMWALAKAPLIMGCDLTTVSQESLDILTNTDLIAVNQDINSKQATCYLGCSWYDELLRNPSVFATSVTGGDVVAMIINWREVSYKNFQFNLEEIGVVPTQGQVVEVYDLWTHEVIGEYEDSEVSGGDEELSEEGLSWDKLEERAEKSKLTLKSSG